MSTDLSNVAEVVAREARKPFPLGSIYSADGTAIDHVALPTGFALHEIDHERLANHPRRKTGTANLQSVDSLLAFVDRHRTASSVVWCQFDPVKSSLRFSAVIDDHAQTSAGWRGLVANYVPELSVEFTRWSSMDKASMSQLEFAEWIERNQDDIAGVENMPTSLDMLKMATEFEASSDFKLKSSVRLQSGGASFEFIDQERDETVRRMSLFAQFALGLPVYRNGGAYQINARLRYRTSQGKLSFSYELLRADKVVEHAGRELIDLVRNGLGETPLLMGTFSK